MRKPNLLFMATLTAVAAIAPPQARADVKLPGLISENMVLQQKAKVNVWGWADDGEEVTVAIQGQSKSTKAKDGKWLVTLDPLKSGGPFSMTIKGKNEIALKNVLVGEVWIASGQSNMQWSLEASFEPEKDIAAAVNDNLRLFYVPRVKAEAPLDDVNAKWTGSTPETAAPFSAVGYYFGRDLQKALGVPLGVIHTSWGGSPAEVWAKESVLKGNAEFKPLLEWHKQSLANWEKAMENHRKAVEKAKADGKTPPRPPRKPWVPCELYNGMIYPLLNYGINGAIWYQGESNASQAELYRALFPAMIQNWRDDWSIGDFTFLCVQLAPYIGIPRGPAEGTWPELREAQLIATEKLPNVGMVVITDVGDAEDIHPRKKAPVGARLALMARAMTYGEDIVYSGPMYDRMEVKGGEAVVHFKHIGGGLATRNNPMRDWEIAGEDGKFVRGIARVEGDTVVVSSEQVDKPTAVRMGWHNYPIVDLFNKEGLPASPFRTNRD